MQWLGASDPEKAPMLIYLHMGGRPTDGSLNEGITKDN